MGWLIRYATGSRAALCLGIGAASIGAAMAVSAGVGRAGRYLAERDRRVHANGPLVVPRAVVRTAPPNAPPGARYGEDDGDGVGVAPVTAATGASAPPG